MKPLKRKIKGIFIIQKCKYKKKKKSNGKLLFVTLTCQKRDTTEHVLTFMPIGINIYYIYIFRHFVCVQTYVPHPPNAQIPIALPDLTRTFGASKRNRLN